MSLDLIIPIAAIATIPLLLFGGRLFIISRRKRFNIQRDYIDTYPFPDGVMTKVQKAYPHLKEHELRKVEKGLREWLHDCHSAKSKVVSMPSQVVNKAWHEFILLTKHYQEFCKQSFNRFLNHTPAEATKKPTKAQAGTTAS